MDTRFVISGTPQACWWGTRGTLAGASGVMASRDTHSIPRLAQGSTASTDGASVCHLRRLAQGRKSHETHGISCSYSPVRVIEPPQSAAFLSMP